MDGWTPQLGQISLLEMKKFGYKALQILALYTLKIYCLGGKQAAKLCSQSFCYLRYRTGKNGRGKTWFGGISFLYFLVFLFSSSSFSFFFLFLLKETKPLSKLVSDNLCPKDGWVAKMNLPQGLSRDPDTPACISVSDLLVWSAAVDPERRQSESWK